jgi:tetratricopeptide (TPR) repeat protein
VNKVPLPAQDDISEAIDRARQAMQRHDWLEAGRCWEEVRERSPLHLPAYLGAGNALREARRYGEAEVVLSAGAELFPDNEQIALALAWLANARHDWPAAVSRWEDFCGRFPDNPMGYVGNLYAQRGMGSQEPEETLLVKAEAALAGAKHRGLGAMAAVRIEFSIARARLDWPLVRQGAEKIIDSEETSSAQVFLGLAQACWHLGDAEEADRAAVKALAADSKLDDAVLVRAWVATERGDEETAVSCYRTLVDLNPETVRWSLKLVQLLTWTGRVPEARSELEKIRKRWPADPMVRMFLRNYGPATVNFDLANAASRPAEGDPDRAEWEELRTIAEKAPGEAEWLRPLVAADPDGDVLVCEVAAAQRAILVFTGGNDAVSMPLAIFDRYLATLPLTIIYLKDFKRLRYLLGIHSLGEDYPGTLAALRSMLNRLGVKRMSTIGNCEGGFAAIRYGVELGADRILTFGAPTFSPDDSLTKIEQARNFMRNRLAAKVPGDMIDLKPFLEARQYNPQLDFFYEEADPRDCAHAMHISGLSGIKLHPQPGLNHRMLRELALSNDDFSGMLGKLLGVERTAIRR